MRLGSLEGTECSPAVRKHATIKVKMAMSDVISLKKSEGELYAFVIVHCRTSFIDIL